MLVQTALKGFPALFSQLASHLASRARWLLAGRIDEILADHQFPLPVDFGDSRLVVRTAEEGRLLLGHLCAAYAGLGVDTLVPTVMAVDLPRQGRFRVWADWHSMAQPGGMMHVASVVYYCRQVPTGLRIEMVDCTRLLVPELHPDIAALALSA
jgi:hypothetical protein